MAKPSSDNGYAYLIGIGIMLAVVTDAIMRAKRNEMAIEHPAVAAERGNITDADIERARINWYYSPVVPEVYRRLLDAEEIG